MRTVLRDDEQVISIVEKHWVVLIKPFAILAASVIALLFMMSSKVEFILSLRWYAALTVLLLLCYFWYSIQARKVNLWIVTSQRVISEEGILTWTAKESQIDKINNVQYSQTVLGRMFGFGDVEIQTAA